MRQTLAAVGLPVPLGGRGARWWWWPWCKLVGHEDEAYGEWMKSWSKEMRVIWIRPRRCRRCGVALGVFLRTKRPKGE